MKYGFGLEISRTNLQSLYYFSVIAQEGSYTKAGKKLFLTEPALSRMMKRLEEEYDCTLIERMPRGICLTDAGETLLQCTQGVLQACKRLEFIMRPMRASGEQTLRIAYTTSGETHYAQQLSEAANCNNIKTINEIWQPKKGVAALKEDQLDGLIINEPMVASEKKLQYTVLHRSGISAFIPVGNPLAKQASVTLRELSGKPVVTFPREVGEPTYDELMKLVDAAGAHLNVAAFSTGTFSFRVMIDTEGYIGVMMSDSKYALISSKLVCMPIEECEGHFSIVLAWRRESPNAALMARIAETC